MNRRERLLGGLPNWTIAGGFTQIVVVDWCSREPLALDEMPPGVLLIRVEGREFWNPARAYNLAVRYADGDVICKLDVDYRITPGFLGEGLKGDEFWRGDRSLSIDGDGSLQGFCRFWKRDWLRVNGYNERLSGYGYDDDDFYFRMERSGLVPRRVGPGGIVHLPHPAALKTENCEEKDKMKSIADNRRRAIQQPWGPADRQAEYTVIEPSERYFRMK